MKAWLNDINESAQRQDAIFFILCAAYALVSVVALIQVIRIQLRVPEYGWTTQKVFHFMNFIIHGVRAIVFRFHMFAYALKPKVLTSVLLDLPGILFFTTYTLLLVFWSGIYYQAKSLPADKLKTVYIKVNCVVYAIQVCIWIYLWIDDSSVIQAIGQVFIAVISFVVALGFLLCGGRLFFLIQSFPIESNGRRQKLLEIGFVTGICFTCFLVRCIMAMVSAFDSDASPNVSDHPILGLIYYVLVEILPSAFVLFILRKLPPKRVSLQHLHSQ